MKLKVETKNHGLIACPVSFTSDEQILDNHFVLVYNKDILPVQYAGQTEDGKHEYAFIIRSLDVGITAEFEIIELKALSFGTAESVASDKSVDVLLNGAKYTSYYFGTDISKPYLGPFYGKKGELITRHNYTGKEHPHHRNIWFSHGDINGTDTWNEPAGKHGYILNKEILNIVNGYAYTQFTAKNLWTHHDKSPIADDTTTIPHDKAPC